MSVNNNINPLQQLPDKSSYLDWLEGFSHKLAQANQRQLLMCVGQREWCLSVLEIITKIYQPVILSNNDDIQNPVVFSKTETLLGQETRCVVYDQFCGLQVDVLSLACGMVTKGGLLVVLRPQDEDNRNDPYGQWQDGENECGYFWNYMDKAFSRSPAVVELRQYAELPVLPEIPLSSMTTFTHGLTAEQKGVLDSMQQWMQENTRPLYFLTADRGRGKSFTLGLFVNQFMQTRQIVVCAASRAQVAILFKVLKFPHDVTFLAPDELIRRQQRIDCLVIDEAAMLPLSMLQRCIELADKTVLATTTGGYEGTGQGFELKFLSRFQDGRVTHQTLKDPVRWGRNDMLEDLFNDVLMLSSSKDEVKYSAATVAISEVTKEQLSENIGLLKATYGLLNSAHYRTRPSDMRQLMDDDNQMVLLAIAGGEVIGVLLLNREGGFDTTLCEDVFLGKRRPRGHLFAQMITAQAGVRDFARHRGFRIQRIAVAKNFRKRGVATLLLQKAETLADACDLDYIGSSFALDATVALFWKMVGYSVIHIGSGKGKSSGRNALAVIKPRNDLIKQSVALLMNKLEVNLPVYLLTYCNDMYWQDVLALLHLLELNYSLTPLEEDEVFSVTEGYRGLELSPVSLHKLVISTLYKQAGLTDTEKRLLIERILFNRDWQQLQAFSTNSGRKQLTANLRQGVRTCYECYRKTGARI